MLTVLVVLWSTSVQAADPECMNPVVYDEAVHGQYDATDNVRFCTPEFDVDGDILEEGDITSCTVTMDTQPFALTSSNRPGQYVNFTTPESVKSVTRSGVIEVFCENAAGSGASAVASNARFRNAAAPGNPTLLQ